MERLYSFDLVLQKPDKLHYQSQDRVMEITKKS